MNNLRRLFPGFVLGLTIAIGGAGFAQQPAQSAGDKKESTCCASCSCCGDSCSLKKKDAMSNHSTAPENHECCCGDSCEMKDGAVKNQAASARHECCGDSRSNKGGTKNQAASGKHEGCCGDSCAIREHTKISTTAIKDGGPASCCAACCKMKDMKEKSGQ